MNCTSLCKSAQLYKVILLYAIVHFCISILCYLLFTMKIERWLEIELEITIIIIYYCMVCALILNNLSLPALVMSCFLHAFISYTDVLNWLVSSMLLPLLCSVLHAKIWKLLVIYLNSSTFLAGSLEKL